MPASVNSNAVAQKSAYGRDNLPKQLHAASSMEKRRGSGWLIGLFAKPSTSCKRAEAGGICRKCAHQRVLREAVHEQPDEASNHKGHHRGNFLIKGASFNPWSARWKHRCLKCIITLLGLTRYLEGSIYMNKLSKSCSPI